jgi:hypothetical protein
MIWRIFIQLEILFSKTEIKQKDSSTLAACTENWFAGECLISGSSSGIMLEQSMGKEARTAYIGTMDL